MTALLTREEAAKVLKVSTKTIDRIIKDRKIPVVRLAGVRIKEKDLEKYIQKRTA